MTPLGHFRLPGNSGFQVELVAGNLVRKSAQGLGAERLRRQIEKQRSFPLDGSSGRIEAPLVRSESATADSYHAEMDFIVAKDFVQFFTEAGRPTLHETVTLLTSFIQGNLARSTEQDVTEKLADKLDELARRGVGLPYLAAARALSTRPVLIPVGPCHGDLTLSNILFKGHRLFFIDFLDSFIESPLLDVVKLQQDTAFGWSLELYTDPFDRTKLRIVLTYLDALIREAFASFRWYQNHYRLFQIVNLMRILPYSSNAPMTQWLHTRLDRLIAESEPPRER
jgi:hypothetical protein